MLFYRAHNSISLTIKAHLPPTRYMFDAMVSHFLSCLDGAWIPRDDVRPKAGYCSRARKFRRGSDSVRHFSSADLSSQVEWRQAFSPTRPSVRPSIKGLLSLSRSHCACATERCWWWWWSTDGRRDDRLATCLTTGLGVYGRPVLSSVIVAQSD